MDFAQGNTSSPDSVGTFSSRRRHWVWRIHTAAKLIGFAEIVTERFVALLL